jgi:hypothetical protein
MTLEWTKIHPDASGSHTKCKRYTTCRAADDGSIWEVWKLVPGGIWFAPLANNLPSEDEAKDAAERDAA